MPVFSHAEFDNHEQVVYCRDAAAGLSAIIAIHNTNLGPALGGCRMLPYESEEAALDDVLRLSRGMTYKAAIADLALGGGKAVVLADSKRDKTEALLTAIGVAVERLGGRYITAEDVGTTVADMDVVRRATRHVSGTTTEAGNPSPSTAHGVFIGMQAAARHAFGSDDLTGRRVAIQGLGSVGLALCRYLKQAGARLVVTDISPGAVERAVKEFGAESVEPEAIYEVEADIFAPCALGGIINDKTVKRLKAPIVAGSANNQLDEPRHGEALLKRGILYAPDYVINAGGLIDVARPIMGMDIEAARVKLRKIYDTLLDIFRRSAEEQLPTSAVADRMAEARFRAAGRA
ncbi:MAG: Leu/Phe/Val dehydrogenase [Candidatus Eiseniibacteriota bacterium]